MIPSPNVFHDMDTGITQSVLLSGTNLILRMLRKAEGNRYHAAKILRITRSTMYGKLRRHGIMVPSND